MDPMRCDHETLNDLQGSGLVAVLNLAWALQRRSNERFLLSGTVDLVPPNSVPEPDKNLRHEELSENYFVYFRRYVLDGAEGLNWYRKCADGDVLLPQVERANTSLQCEQLLPEPPWPQLYCSTTTAVPGSMAGDLPARTGSLIPSAPGWEARYWTPEERGAAFAFLRDSMSFDFAVDPEYLGGAHLVVADPELYAVDLTREGQTESGGIILRLSARFHGPQADGFTFVLHRHRPRGAEAPVILPLCESCMLELAHKPFSFSYDVVHEQRGMIYSYGPAVFLEGFDLEMGLVTRSRRVQVPQVRRRPAEEYDVPLVRDVQRVSSSSSGSRTAAQILSANRAKQEKRRPPYQRWFDGSAHAAAPALRELLAQTKREAFVVDPYFDHVEFERFGLSLGRQLAPLRLLTSAEGLRSVGTSEGVTPGTKLLQVVEAASGARALAGHPVLEVRVMRGARPEVHDRFIALDDCIWLLGSSLNEFGSRGTVLVALPDPDPVLAELEKAWARAISLSEWTSLASPEPESGAT